MRIRFYFTIKNTNSLWSLYKLREFTMDSVSYSRIYYGFSLLLANSFCVHYSFANSLWIDSLTREFTLNLLWVHYYLRKITINYFSIAKSLWIHYSLREFAINSLSFYRFQYKLIISNTNSLWIQLLFRGLTMNLLLVASLSVTRIHYEFFISCSNSLCIYCFFANSL